MVAGTGYDACRQDRRHTLAVSPAGRTGNPKSVRRSPGLLADLTVRQFWSVRVTSAVTLTLCALAVAGAVGMILELEQGFGGLIHISPQPMRQAVEVLEARLTGDESP